MFAFSLGSAVLLAVVLCELILLAFLFCISRFYEQKFAETTYYLLYLLPVLLFAALAVYSMASGLEAEWASLLTNACAIIVLGTAGLFLYKKMMGVSE